MIFSAKGCLSFDLHKLSRHTSPIPHDALDHLLSKCFAYESRLAQIWFISSENMTDGVFRLSETPFAQQ